MNRTVVRFLIGLAVIAIVGGLIGWWITRDTPTPPAPPVVQQDPEPTNATPTPGPPSPTILIEEITADTPPIDDSVVTVFNWENKLDDVLATDKIDTDAKAEKIVAMITIPNMPPAAQKELAEHLVNLVADEFYADTGKILTNAETPADVSRVLLDDLFNRDHELMLPLTLEVAQNPKHPLKDEARDTLELVLQPVEDPGTNWLQWSNLVQKAIKGEVP